MDIFFHFQEGAGASAFWITSFTTLGNGISNYTAQNLGAHRSSRIESGFRAGIELVWSLSLPLSLLYFFWGRGMLYLFLERPTDLALQTGVTFLRILSPFYLVVSAKLVADGILRGCGSMKKFMIATFVDLILRVTLAILLAKTALGATGIWCAWPAGWVTASVLSIAFYRAEPWRDAAAQLDPPACGSVPERVPEACPTKRDP